MFSHRCIHCLVINSPSMDTIHRGRRQHIVTTLETMEYLFKHVVLVERNCVEFCQTNII